MPKIPTPEEVARDRWIEALLGARLRFHAHDAGPDDLHYWSKVYKRWSQLYHGPTSSRLMS